MKPKAFNIDPNLISTLVYSLIAADTAIKTYRGITNFYRNFNKILISGLIDGLNHKRKENSSSISSLFNKLENKIESDNPGYLKKAYKDIIDNYNKQYNSLKEIAENQDLEENILLFPDNFSGNNRLHIMLTAAEKLANKSSSEKDDYYKSLTKASIHIKAASNTSLGYILANIFSLGQYIGRNIGDITESLTGEDIKNAIIDTLKDSLIVWDYLIDITHKNLNFPSKASELLVSSMILITTGFIDSIINEDINSKHPKLSKEKTKNLYETVNSSISNLKDTFSLQKRKLEKLNISLTKNNNYLKLLENHPESENGEYTKRILQNSPWKKPSNLVSRKTMLLRDNIMPALLEITDSMKVTRKTITGTIFSNSFKLGSWLGEAYLKSDLTINEQRNYINPTSTPNKKMERKNKKGIRNK